MKRVLNLKNCEIRTFEENKKLKQQRVSSEVYNPYDERPISKSKFRCINFN